MAYEVTATRRRPQTFDALVGQEFVAETLKNSIKAGKIAHAYLFSGPRGCGKTSTARILAKSLNCREGPTATPCGKCDACREISAGSSMDVIEIDGASNTSVNDVRAIKDEVVFPPNSSRYKIYIIDEVHMLSTPAFNALLKTIEEPPPYVVFIFATTELQKVPATIKSRCQQFTFRLVAVDKIKEQLSLAAAELGIKAEDEALFWIAREATGSMRDAYTLFDQVASFSGGEITYEKIRDKLGLVGIDRLNDVFSLCVKGEREEVLLRLDEYLQSGVSIEQLISGSADYLRSSLLIKSGVTKEALLGQSAARYSPAVIEGWSEVQLERALSIFARLYRDIRYSLSPRYELELAFSRLCWLKDYVSASDVKKAIDEARGVLRGGASSPAAKSPGAFSAAQSSASSPAAENPASSPARGVESTPGFRQPSGALPTFSALKPEPKSAASSGSPPPTPPQTSPFSRGGAEPPVNKSVAFDAGEIRQSVIENFSRSEPFLASAIERTKEWKTDGTTITLRAENPADVSQIKAKEEQVLSYIYDLYNRRFFLEINLSEKGGASQTPVIPAEVDILRKMFRASVVTEQ